MKSPVKVRIWEEEEEEKGLRVFGGGKFDRSGKKRSEFAVEAYSSIREETSVASVFGWMQIMKNHLRLRTWRR